MTRITSTLKTKAAHLLGASCLAVATLSLSAVAPIGAAYAQDKPTEGRQFGAATGEQVNLALTAANNGDTNGAANILQSALALPNLNAYEMANTARAHNALRIS